MPYYAQQRGTSLGGESVLASALEALNGAIDEHMERKRVEREEERKFKLATRNADMGIAMANAEIESRMGEQQRDMEDRRNKAAVQGQAVREQRERDAIAMQLRERIAGGNTDPRLRAWAGQMGMSAADMKAIEPTPEKPSVEDESYARRKGVLRADKEMGTGAFAPKKANTEGGSTSPLERRRRAQEALRTHIPRVLDVKPNASATDVYMEIMNDPTYADINGDVSYGRALQSQVAAEMNAERNRRAKPAGKSSFGASIRALKTPPK